MHVKRKFWWELIFISVLIFLLAGVRSQWQREDVAAVQAALPPAIVALVPAVVDVDPASRAVLGTVGTPLPPPGALQ